MKERGQRKMFSCQKHFSKVNPVQNDNNNNKIVVKKFKRASSSASNLSGNEEGAMTLEASLIVPIFLIVLLMLTSAGEILMVHQQISHGACEAAKRAAVNEYRIRQKKKSGSDLSGFSAKAAFLAAVNRKFLDHSALIGGSAGAAAACRLTLTSKGEYIVSVRYYIRKTMPFLSTHTVSYEQSVRQKSMTGYVPDGDELKKGYPTGHSVLYNFLKEGANSQEELENVKRNIRLSLEGMFKIKFFEYNNNNTWLGSFLEFIEKSVSDTNYKKFERLYPHIQKLRNINHYSSPAHHAGETNKVNSIELQAYVADTLELIDLI